MFGFLLHLRRVRVICSSTRWKVEELSSPGRFNRSSKGTCSQRRNVEILRPLSAVWAHFQRELGFLCKLPGRLRENTSLCGLTSSLTLAWPKVASRSRNKPATSNSIYYLNDTISSSLLPPPVLFSTPFLHCSLRLPSAPRPQHSTFLNFGLAVVSLTQFGKNGSVSHTEFTPR